MEEFKLEDQEQWQGLDVDNLDGYINDEEDQTIFYCLSEKNTSIMKHIVEMMAQISAVECGEDNKKHVKQLYMKISKNTLEFFSDPQKVVTSSVVINKNFFKFYDFNQEDDLCIGMSMMMLKSSFKNVNRLDSISIKIVKSLYNNFPSCIEFTMKENLTGFSIKFNIVQNIDITENKNFYKLFSVDSSRFTNIYKEVGGIKKQVLVSIQNGVFTLTSSTMDIVHNWVKFNVDETSEFYNYETEDDLNRIIKSDHLKYVSKLQNFDKNIDIYLDPEFNMMLKTNLVNHKESKEILGKITLIIFSVNLNQ